MRYQKYVFLLLFIMVLGINRVYADTDSKCYYSGNGSNLTYDPTTGDVTIDVRGGGKNNIFKTEPLINRKKDKKDSETGITVKAVSSGCPRYLVFRQKVRSLWFDSDGVWGFDNASDANSFKTASAQVSNMKVWLTDRYTSSGTIRTSEQYYAEVLPVYDVTPSTTTKKEKDMRVKSGGKTVTITCDQLFDAEFKKMLEDILLYPKFIVPALIVGYGSFDFFKAVVAQKEDDMKKAQKTFIKRIIMGVLVFFVPVFINAIMNLANIAWEGLGYTSCNFK